MTASPPLSGEQARVPVHPVQFSHTADDEPARDQGELQRPGRAPFTAPPVNPEADPVDDFEPAMPPHAFERPSRPRASARAPRRNRY